MVILLTVACYWLLKHPLVLYQVKRLPWLEERCTCPLGKLPAAELPVCSVPPLGPAVARPHSLPASIKSSFKAQIKQNLNNSFTKASKKCVTKHLYEESKQTQHCWDRAWHLLHP